LTKKHYKEKVKQRQLILTSGGGFELCWREATVATRGMAAAYGTTVSKNWKSEEFCFDKEWKRDEEKSVNNIEGKLIIKYNNLTKKNKIKYNS
jgi:hypothetical protein